MSHAGSGTQDNLRLLGKLKAPTGAGSSNRVNHRVMLQKGNLEATRQRIVRPLILTREVTTRERTFQAFSTLFRPLFG